MKYSPELWAVGGLAVEPRARSNYTACLEIYDGYLQDGLSVKLYKVTKLWNGDIRLII